MLYSLLREQQIGGHMLIDQQSRKHFKTRHGFEGVHRAKPSILESVPSLVLESRAGPVAQKSCSNTRNRDGFSPSHLHIPKNPHSSTPYRALPPTEPSGPCANTCSPAPHSRCGTSPRRRPPARSAFGAPGEAPRHVLGLAGWFRGSPPIDSIYSAKQK